jgi:predicted permease
MNWKSTVVRRRRRRPPALLSPASEGSWVAGLGGELRYAVQLLRRQWGHTLVVVLTMALGVGASTVLFSVAYGVLVKPLPWPDAGRLVRFYETREGSPRPVRFVTNAAYLSWADSPTTIDALGGWSASAMTVTGGGDAERLQVAGVTPGLLPLLDARTAVGRLFDLDGQRVPDERQVVLSHGLWLERFGGRAEAIGETLRLDGVPHRVAGVMERTFVFPARDVRAWTPFVVPPVVGAEPGRRTLSMFQAIARLRPGATVDQAAAEATARTRGGPDPGLVAVAVFGSKGQPRVSVVPLSEAVTGEVRPALILFLAAVGLLLATATANVASLQLARATGRRREMAIRAALGAGTVRLTRQLLVENGLLGLAGGLSGLVLASWLVRTLPALLPRDFPRVADIAVDWRVAAFSLGVSLLAGLAFGLAPALNARRLKLTPALLEDGTAPLGGGTRTVTARVRLMIMAGQVAVAAVLLVGAALLGRSFVALLTADRGYDASNLLTARLPIPGQVYDPARRAALMERLLDRLKAVPGVTAAAWSTGVPLMPGDTLAAFTMPSPRGEGTVQVHASIRHVTAEYFAALRLRIAQGRPFTNRDDTNGMPVLVVNAAFARQYLGESPVGARLPSSDNRNAMEAEVVGVVEDVRNGAVSDPVVPEIYRCIAQLSGGLEDEEPSLVLRASTDPGRLVPTVRSILREQDTTLALESVMTMEERVMSSLAKPRLYAVLLGGFAAFALAVAAVGLFGVLSYGVQLRTRELGVRAALGATPSAIAGLVLRQALGVTAIGLAVGLAASAALARYVSRLLYGVSPYDAASFVAVPLLILAVAVLACLVPARRAARVDPVRVLR